MHCSIEYATLNVWHSTISIDRITARLQIEPHTWLRHGQEIDEMSPAAVGNHWTLTSSGDDALACFTRQFLQKKKELAELIHDGAKAHIIVYYERNSGDMLPKLTAETQRLIWGLQIDLMLRPSRTIRP